MRRRRTSLETRALLLARLDVWTLKWGPLDPLGGPWQRAIIPMVPVRLLEPMWRACLSAKADGSATPEILALIDYPDCWAREEFGLSIEPTTKRKGIR
jgi:hypothetical protein